MAVKKKQNMVFDKDLFIRSVLYNVKTLYRKTLEEATQQQIFQAVSLAIKDVVVDNWLKTQKEYEEKDPKIVYYMSMEFLMGRALGNNIINLRAYEAVKEALDELGVDLNVVEHMAVVSDINTVCLNRRFVTDIRLNSRMIG